MPLPLPCPGFHLLLPLLHILCPVIHKHLSFLCRVSWICPWVLVSAVTSQSQVPIKSHINDCSSLLTSFFPPHFLSNPQAAARLSIAASISLPWWGCCSVGQLCLTLCNPMDCSTPGLPVPHHLPEFAQVHVHYTDDAILSWVFCLDSTSISSSDTLISFCLQSFPSPGTFPMSCLFSSDDQNTGASLNISIGSSSDYSGLISLKIDWFDLLAVQGTFRSLLQHHSSKTSILWRSAFFMVQLSQLYMTTGKDYSLDSMDLCQQRNVSASQQTVERLWWTSSSN